MSLTCDKVGDVSLSCFSTVSIHWSKRVWNCWRSASHCLLARTSVKEITSAHPMGESSQMRLARACPHYREVPYGMSESPNAPWQPPTKNGAIHVPRATFWHGGLRKDKWECLMNACFYGSSGIAAASGLFLLLSGLSLLLWLLLRRLRRPLLLGWWWLHGPGLCGRL